MSCKCKEKKVLEQGDDYGIATVTHCPEHGQGTSCYICNPGFMTPNGMSWGTTERCAYHRSDAYKKQCEEWFKDVPHLLELMKGEI